MIEALTRIAETGQAHFMVALIVFLRVGAAMALLPAFGEHAVPQRIRLVLTLAFTLIVFPAVTPVIPIDAAPGLPLLAEVIVGLAIGAALRIFVMVLQIAGTMAAQATSLSQIFGGAGADPQPAIAQILLVAGLALAVMLGLHLRLAELLILSYDILPYGAMPHASDLGAWGLAQVSKSFALAFSLAAPFAIASLVYNVALGVINRAMPQLMVAFVGAPAITAGGLLLLMLVAPMMLSIWIDAFNALLENPFGAAP